MTAAVCRRTDDDGVSNGKMRPRDGFLRSSGIHAKCVAGARRAGMTEEARCSQVQVASECELWER